MCRISERAKAILHPHDPAERAHAIRQAAAEPKLFAELTEKFPGMMLNDELLRNYLVRNEFAPAAASTVILAYRQTQKFVDSEMGDYDSATGSTRPEPMPMLPTTTTAPIAPQPAVVAMPTGEPYLLSVGPGRLQGTFDLKSVADADDMMASTP